MLRKLFVGLLIVVPVLRWSVGCSSSHPDTISQYPGATGHEIKPQKELPPIQSARLCIQTARQLEAAGYLADAVQQYERARRFNPLDNTISHRLAILYDRLGDAQNASLEYENALRVQPNNSDLLNDFGYFHYTRGHWDRAEQAFRKALSINSTHKRAITNLAMTLAQQNRYEESIKWFEKVVAPASAYSNLAAIQAQQGHIDLARKTVDKALMFNPDLAQAHAIQSFVNEQEKRIAVAKPAWPAAEQPVPKAATKTVATASKTTKFVPVVADPVIAPKPQTQTLASAAPVQSIHIEAVPESQAPVVAQVPAPAPAIQPALALAPVPADISARVDDAAATARIAAVPARENAGLSADAVSPATPAPAEVTAHVEAAVPSVPVAEAPALQTAGRVVVQPASPAPAELPPLIAKAQQRKLIEPVGIRPAREEELASTVFATPEPAAFAPMVAPAPTRHAELALAAPTDSTALHSDSPRAGKLELPEAAPMVEPIASDSAPMAGGMMPALHVEDAAVADSPKLRPTAVDVMIAPARTTNNAASPEAAFVSNHQQTSATPRESPDAPAIVVPMIEPAKPMPAPRSESGKAEKSVGASREVLAANVIIAPAEAPAAPTMAPEVSKQPAPALPHIDAAPVAPMIEDAPLIVAVVTDAPVHASSATVREVIPPRRETASPISLAAAHSAPLEVAAAPAPEQAAPSAPVTHAQTAPIWVEPPPQVRFTKGRGPSLVRNLE